MKREKWNAVRLYTELSSSLEEENRTLMVEKPEFCLNLQTNCTTLQQPCVSLHEEPKNTINFNFQTVHTMIINSFKWNSTKKG